MIWIKKIIIENFESHKYSEIEFSSGFNIITGSSNSGKSSIIRAIRWLCFNEPSGDKFIRKDEDYIEETKSDKQRKKRTVTRVYVDLSNGYSIERLKNRDNGHINKYIIINQNGERVEFDKFGTEVPDEVKAALGFSYVKSGNKKLEINHLSQFETPRALSYQGANLSNLINKLNNISNFEEALSEINNRYRGELSTKEKIYSEKIDNLNEQLKNYQNHGEEIQYIKEIILPKLKKALEKEKQIENAKKILNDFHNLKSSYKKLINSIKNIKENQIPIEQIEQIDIDLQRIKNFYNYKKELYSIDERIEILNKKIRSVNTISNIDMSIIDKRLNKINKAKEIINNSILIENKINKNKEIIGIYNSDISDICKSLEDYIKSIVVKSQTCPMCRQSLDNNSINNMVKYLEFEE
jgi:exonuclease SbcC